MHDFTTADLVQTTSAVFAFTLFLVPPGYLLGLASNGFDMRRRPAVEKILFSIVLSFAVTPILAVLLTRWVSYRLTLAVFLLLAAISLGTLACRLKFAPIALSGVRRSTWIVLGMMLAWFMVVLLSLADLQVGHRLYVSFVAFDHSVRVPLVEAAARGGVPPRNPFYGLGSPPVLRYFYYWYVVCALPMRLFGLGAKGCFNASVFWSGVGLAATIPLFLKYFLGERNDLRRKSVIGIALLAVTGLDIIPYAAMTARMHTFLPDLEWWDTNQVTSWVGSLLWVPHHVASLTACMAGLLALSGVDEQSTPRSRVWRAVLAGGAFASAAGLSVYVAFSFGLFASFWAVQTLWQKRIRTFVTFAGVGAFAVLLSWPFLSDLLSKPVATGVGGDDGGERFARFAIRDFPDAIGLLGSLGVQNPVLLELSKLPILLAVYAFEFGFFALILVLRLRRDRRDSSPLTRQSRMAWTMLVVCLMAMSFLKSDSTSQNDLGFRGMLVVQFILLIWAAPIFHDILRSGSSWIRTSLLCTLAVGVAGSGWQLVALRCYTPLADSGRVERVERFLGSPGFGERTYWMREGFYVLNKRTPSSAVVQYNPVRDEVLIAHLYSTRQATMGDAFCGNALGGDVAKCRKVFPSIAAVFNDPGVARTWDLDRFCDEFQVNVLTATDTDPVWNDRSSWVWSRPTLMGNPAMRAIPCGTAWRSARDGQKQ